MRKIVSPLDGVRSPFPNRQDNAAVTLLQSEAQGLAVDFTKNQSAVRVS